MKGDTKRGGDLSPASADSSFSVVHYLKFYAEFDALLLEITQKGAKPELVLNRRDADGQNLEQRISGELDRWRRARSDDADVLQIREERIQELEYLLFRIRGAIYTLNGLAIPGMNRFAGDAQNMLLPGPLLTAEPLRSESDTPEAAADRLRKIHSDKKAGLRRALIAKELDKLFPNREGEGRNPLISHRKMGELISDPDEHLAPTSYKSRGLVARKKARDM